MTVSPGQKLIFCSYPTLTDGCEVVPPATERGDKVMCHSPQATSPSDAIRHNVSAHHVQSDALLRNPPATARGEEKLCRQLLWRNRQRMVTATGTRIRDS
eukprot:scpid30140/ scgid19559/ 